jgi:hypothetical protein
MMRGMRYAGFALLIAVLAMCTTVSASAATPPDWYPQLKLAVGDTQEAAAAVGACAVPRAAAPKAGRACALSRAGAELGVLQRVSVFTETGEPTGPCKRLLFVLDHTTTTAVKRALAYAYHDTATTSKDVRGRRALERAATSVTHDFAALQHCLGAS